MFMGNTTLLYSSLLYTNLLFYHLRKALVFEIVPVVYM